MGGENYRRLVFNPGEPTMKKVLILVSSIVLSIGLVHAQSLGPSGFGQGQSVFAPCPLGPDDITQSFDCSIEPFTGIACNGTFTTDTHNLRRFFLTADHGIIDDYTVDEVQFGVEVDDLGAGVGNPITVNVHAIPIGAAFTFANMGAPLDSVVVELDGNTDFTIVTAVMNGTAVIDPATDDLVVDYVSFDHNDALSGGNFFPGANMLGETQETYLAADDCGIPEPVTLADLGFPGTAYVVIVNGTEGGGGPEFTLLPVDPGQALTANTWTTLDGTPDRRHIFFFGESAGTTPVGLAVCAGTDMDIDAALTFASPVADGAGSASTTQDVGPGLAGSTFLFQALDLFTCETSNVVTETF